MVRLVNLGVVVASTTIALIAKSILTKLAAGALSYWLAVRATAGEFQELQRLKDEGFHELANLLARGSDLPEWEWFQMLKSMQEYGLLAPNQDPPPIKQPGMGQGWMTWAVVAALVVSVVFLSKKS